MTVELHYKLHSKLLLVICTVKKKIIIIIIIIIVLKNNIGLAGLVAECT